MNLQNKTILFLFLFLIVPTVSAVISGGYCSLTGCNMFGDIDMNNNTIFNVRINGTLVILQNVSELVGLGDAIDNTSIIRDHNTSWVDSIIHLFTYRY